MTDEARDSRAPRWTFLTHHGHVLVAVAADGDATVAQIAERVGVTARTAVTILNDLAQGGYIHRERRGRRNHYTIDPDRPLRHPSNSAHSVGDLIDALADLA
ncbi:helix-turn-helix transcriptional regulator [Isoptericola jiangsuensis]|nr:winged helix-turn-helix domain-containing protein [Isoptericola jiangsuensis]